jgi:hypothetical protein
VAAAAGVALGVAVVPSRSAEVSRSATHRVELRALYDPTGRVVDVRRIETWRSPDDLDRRAVVLRSGFELGWLRRVRDVRLDGRRAVVLRAASGSPIERGWTVAVDPASFVPLAGERRAGGLLVERRRLLVDERVPLDGAALDQSSPSRAGSVSPVHRRLMNTDHDARSTMTNRKAINRALAALSVAGALAGAQAANASAAPGSAPIRHWVIESKTMSGDTGRTEGWQRGGDRHVLVGDPGGPGFPWCPRGRAQDWRVIGATATICGRSFPRRGSGTVARQIMNPTELGELVRDSIDRGGYEAAGEDVVDGRRVTVWREADRSGLEPEDERKLILTTYYLDADDGSFVAERDDDVASGRTQQSHVVVDEVVAASAARLARAGLARHTKAGR